jgi:hypothetical protein
VKPLFAWSHMLATSEVTKLWRTSLMRVFSKQSCVWNFMWWAKTEACELLFQHST